MEKEKQIIVESIAPEDLVDELFKEIKDFLQKEYKTLSLFREVKERVSNQDGGMPWGMNVTPNKEYDLHLRVQGRLRQGRVSILRKLKLVKSFFDEETLQEIFDEEKHVAHITRLFEIVYRFFSENKTIAVIDAEESLDSLTWYVERIKEKLSEKTEQKK